MSTDALAAVESSGTIDAPTDDKRILDLGDVEPASIPGATVVFATAYTRTDDGAALRYDGDVPVAAVGVYSETDAREALAECYDAANIDRAFRVGEWLDSEKPARATAAVSCVESAAATDGGVAIAEGRRLDSWDDADHGDQLRYVGDRDDWWLDRPVTFRHGFHSNKSVVIERPNGATKRLLIEEFPAGDFVVER